MNSSTETYICTTCHQAVPLLNQIVHSARCRAIPSTSLSNSIIVENEQISSTSVQKKQRSSSNNNIWVCSTCTYENSNASSECLMCGSSLTTTLPSSSSSAAVAAAAASENMYSESEVEFIQPSAPPLPETSSHTSAFSSSAVVPAAASSTERWTCQACTFINRPELDHCQMCDTRNLERENSLITSTESSNESQKAEGIDQHGASSADEREQEQARQRRDMDRAISYGTVGALGGAALFGMRDRNWVEGAMIGAGVGLVGSAVVGAMSRSGSSSSSTTTNNLRPGRNPSSLEPSDQVRTTSARVSHASNDNNIWHEFPTAPPTALRRRFVQVHNHNPTQHEHAIRPTGSSTIALYYGGEGEPVIMRNDGRSTVHQRRVARQLQMADPMMFELMERAMMQMLELGEFGMGAEFNDGQPRPLSERTRTQLPRMSATSASISATPTCNICLEDFVEGVDMTYLPCTHKFHVNCIDQWLRKASACPVCKSNIQ